MRRPFQGEVQVPRILQVPIVLVREPVPVTQARWGQLLMDGTDRDLFRSGLKRTIDFDSVLPAGNIE